MTENKKWMKEIDAEKTTKVNLVYLKTLTSEGMGKIAIEGKNGEITIIVDVLYVHGMQSNLLNVSQLVQNGYLVTMKDNSLKLFDKGQRLVNKLE